MLELREMGTRDRILGDVNFLGPMESGNVEYAEDEDKRKGTADR